MMSIFRLADPGSVGAWGSTARPYPDGPAPVGPLDGNGSLAWP